MADDVKKPDNDKTITENKTPADEKNAQTKEQLNPDGNTPTPDKTTEEVAALAQAEKSTTDDSVVTYDFNTKNKMAQDENLQGDKTTTEEKPKEEKPPETPSRRGRPPKVEKADKSEEKPKTEKEPKPEKKPKPKKPGKQQGGGIGGVSSKLADKAEKQPETPAPPPEPQEAPRSGVEEKIVYINLSELHPFKDHPFQVKQRKGYQGIYNLHENSLTPYKKPKGGKLTIEQKAFNSSLSKFRILIEHVNRRIKRFKMFQCRYRNKQRKHHKRISLICGIHNFELRLG